MTAYPQAFPATRLRRLRQARWIRDLTAESTLTPADLIWSIVVHDGEEPRIPVESMPGNDRLNVSEAARAARRARELAIPAIAIFPHIDPSKKDAQGSEGLNPTGWCPRHKGDEGCRPGGRHHLRRGPGPVHQPRP